MIHDADPIRKWKRKIFDESALQSLSPRERSDLETDRDLAKPPEQLVSDVHEETHDSNRTDLQNIAGAHKRMVSLMARIASSNETIASRTLYLTVAIALMTLIMLLLTFAIWRSS